MPEHDKNTKPFRLLLIGAGPVVRSLQLPALATLGWLESALAVDLSAESLAGLQKLAPSLRVQRADYRDVLADPKIASSFDAAVVNLPNSLHLAAAELALERGLPVFCEKPLAMTAADCERLDRAARNAQRMLSVGMVMRHLPGVLALREAIAGGLIGEVLEVDVEDGGVFAWDSDSGGYFTKTNGGVLLNMGVHYLDLLMWLFGKLEPVQYADDAAGGVDANFEYRLRAGQLPVRLEVSYSRPLRNSIIVRGSSGTLIFDKGKPAFCELQRQGVSAALQHERPFKHGRWVPTLMACFVEQFAVFAEAVRAGGPAPVPASDAIVTGQLMDWAAAHRVPLNPRVHRVVTSAQALQGVSGRVVVTGSTGFVGARLIGALAQQSDVEIIGIVRSFKNGAVAGRLPIRQVKASLMDVDALRQAFRGARHVFHLAYGSDGADASRTTIEGTLNVCRAAIAEGAQSVVVVGTTAVYPPVADDSVIDEGIAPRTEGSPYELAKAEMVNKVLALAASSAGTRVVVLEPACIYGPGGKPFTEMPLKLAAAGQLAWVEDGRGTANYVYVDNFVDALLRAATTPQAHAQRFIIQDGFVTWREFLAPLLGERAASLPHVTVEDLQNQPPEPPASIGNIVKAALRSPDLVRTVQAWPPIAASRRLVDKRKPDLIDRLRDLRDKGLPSPLIIPEVGAETSAPPARPPDWLASLYGPGSPKLSNQKARKLLGWEPITKLAEGQAIAVEWLRYVRLRRD
jgi:predicted dehydrogenase